MSWVFFVPMGTTISPRDVLRNHMLRGFLLFGTGYQRFTVALLKPGNPAGLMFANDASVAL